MTDAFQCERCGGYGTGSGHHVRIGLDCADNCTSLDYLFSHETELCTDCHSGLVDTVDEYLEVSDDE